MAKTEVKEWQNRIVGYGEESPDQLLANPRNHRIHPKRQQDALSGSLETLGLIQTVIVNKATGHIVDGHLRVVMALREGQTSIPVTYVELTEAEEAQALLSLDPIAAMAANDKDKVDELLRMVNTDNEQVMKHLADFAKENMLNPEVLGEGDAFGKLPSEDRAPFQQMTFTLHDEQSDVVREALKLSKGMGAFTDSPNENSNGNALARICEMFITEHGNS